MYEARWVLAVTVAWSLACGGGGGSRKATVPDVVHPTDEAVSIGEFEVEVHGSSRTGRVGGKFVNYAAPDGATLQIVDVSVKNDFNKPQAMVGRFSLVKGDRTYNPTTECQIALKGNWNLLEQVNPGVRRRAKVCFEVPADAEGLDFGFKPALFSKPSVFDLD